MSKALIRKLSCFATLSAHDRAALARLGTQRVRRLASHITIIEEDEKPNAVYVIDSGWACGYKSLESGERQIVSFLLPGDICQPNPFVLHHMDHSIGTITPVTVFEIARRGFDELTANHPHLVQAMWWEALVSASIQREWIVNIAQRAAPHRVAHLICELFWRLQSTDLTDGKTCEFPLTQKDIGDALGLTGIHVNRMLQQLRSDDLIALKGRVLTIPDIKALQRFAAFHPNYLHLGEEGSARRQLSTDPANVRLVHRLGH